VTGRDKDAARTAGFARRKAAHAAAGPGAAARLVEVLDKHRGRTLSGYCAMRTEIDPMPAMAAMAAHGRVCVPVIEGRGRPLRFREWTPASAMVDGTFGAAVPETGDWLTPEVLIVPLVAFDRRGGRLGYGGGFYDRTLAGLRARGPVTAIGFAYAAQEAGEVPLEPADELLDLIVTERETIRP
jgi:5-formyltetrahydrofolate cyclo-ligase